MRRMRVLWEVYVTRFEEALDRYKQHRLSAEEAGELLGLSGRHFRRQCARYEAEGMDGLRDKRLGRVSDRRAPESELARMRGLYREEYADFTVKHFHEEVGTATVSATRCRVWRCNRRVWWRRPGGAASTGGSVSAGRCREAVVSRRFDASLDRHAGERSRPHRDAG